MPGKELSTIDFESLIGGPLIAVVHAQAQSAMSTVDFIKQVGFKAPTGTLPDPSSQATGDPATVTFSYQKQATDSKGVTTTTPTSLTVPLLTMLPVPYLRVEEVNIDFLAKITSVQTRQTDTNLTISSELQAKAGWLFGSASLKVNTAFQRQTKEGSTVTRDYSMGVKVKAVQDQMPAGLEKVLSILESNIVETAKASA